MEAKIAALEEEISILKGEIKSILQEVRTAVLAAENPFTGSGFRSSGAPAAEAATTPSPQVQSSFAPPSPAANEPPAAPVAQEPAPQPMAAPVRVAAEAPAWTDGNLQTEEEPPTNIAAMEPGASKAPQEIRASRPEHRAVAATETRRSLPMPRPADEPRPLSIASIAALVSWVEETRGRLTEPYLNIVLGLARYARLIDSSLEEILLKVSGMVEARPEREKASVSDCLLALRQLAAVVADDGIADLALERRRRMRRLARRAEHREVWSSRRQ